MKMFSRWPQVSRQMKRSPKISRKKKRFPHDTFPVRPTNIGESPVSEVSAAFVAEGKSFGGAAFPPQCPGEDINHYPEEGYPRGKSTSR